MAEKKRTVFVPSAERQASEENQTPVTDSVDKAQHFDLDPREMTSIVNGNRVVVLSKGIESVSVKRSDKA